LLITETNKKLTRRIPTSHLARWRRPVLGIRKGQLSRRREHGRVGVDLRDVMRESRALEAALHVVRVRVWDDDNLAAAGRDVVKEVGHVVDEGGAAEAGGDGGFAHTDLEEKRI
jgi:hypothetical protein